MRESKVVSDQWMRDSNRLELREAKEALMEVRKRGRNEANSGEQSRFLCFGG